MKRTASAFATLAASCTPALAHVAPWSSPDPPPLHAQFLIGIALMAGAGAVIVWHGAALAREALARAGAPPRTPSRAPERLRFPAVRIIQAAMARADVGLQRPHVARRRGAASSAGGSRASLHRSDVRTAGRGCGRLLIAKCPRGARTSFECVPASLGASPSSVEPVRSPRTSSDRFSASISVSYCNPGAAIKRREGWGG